MEVLVGGKDELFFCRKKFEPVFRCEPERYSGDDSTGIPGTIDMIMNPAAIDGGGEGC